MDERERLKVVLSAMSETKAEEVVVFDMLNRSPITDFVVLCNGRSQGHVRGIAEKVQEAMRNAGSRANTIEGLQEGSWVLMDFDVVLAHVFHPETRAYYDLDTLLDEYPRVDPESGKTEPRPEAGTTAKAASKTTKKTAPPKRVQMKTTAKGATKTAVKTGAKAGAKSVSKSSGKLVGRAAVKANAKTASKITSKTAKKPAAKSSPKPSAKSTAKPAGRTVATAKKSRG